MQIRDAHISRAVGHKDPRLHTVVQQELQCQRWELAQELGPCSAGGKGPEDLHQIHASAPATAEGLHGAVPLRGSEPAVWKRVWESLRGWKRVWERVWERVLERVWERVWNFWRFFLCTFRFGSVSAVWCLYLLRGSFLAVFFSVLFVLAPFLRFGACICFVVLFLSLFCLCFALWLVPCRFVLVPASWLGFAACLPVVGGLARFRAVSCLHLPSWLGFGSPACLCLVAWLSPCRFVYLLRGSVLPLACLLLGGLAHVKRKANRKRKKKRRGKDGRETFFRVESDWD